ncbi:MAG: D-amino acid dehydrogenase [Alphaproteobacteria bacterium]
MKVVVLGSGVIGVTTAYYLAKAGCTVIVVDRQREPARETSFANAGLIAVGHPFVWATPEAPRTLLLSLLKRDGPLRLSRPHDPRLWPWGVRFLSRCTRSRAEAAAEVMYRLARYSQHRLAELVRETAIRFHRSRRGVLYFYRNAANFERAVGEMAKVRDWGHEVEILDPDGCVAVEPALAPIRSSLAGAVHCPTDESGDCHAFTMKLAEWCREHGVGFRLGTRIRSLDRRGGRIAAVMTDTGPISGDAFVLALGSYSPIVARSAGLRLPIYPVKGYSVTVPITNPELAPAMGGADQDGLVGYSPLGNSLRLTSTAEFAGYDTSYCMGDAEPLLRRGRELFGRGLDFNRIRLWSCLRPMTPDGPPVLGRCRFDNLFLNTGHGHMGWTLACGSGKVVADTIVGSTPEPDMSGLSHARYRWRPRPG